MPHECEVRMKTILTDKNFNPTQILRSGFNDFLNLIISYLGEYNKKQEKGLFKRAKYPDTKSIIKSLNVILKVANANNLKTECLKPLDQIFCQLLHPKTPTVYRNDAVDLFFLILSILPEENVSYFANSITLLVPHYNVAQAADRQDRAEDEGGRVHRHPAQDLLQRRAREGRDRGRQGQARVRQAPDPARAHGDP